jgi:predicted transposase/invertase (TIGR01784 family)
MKKINPTSDLAFKKAFGSSENVHILKGLISDIYLFEPEELVIQNPYDIKAYTEMVEKQQFNLLKQIIADVSASMRTGNYTSEMQVLKKKYFDERALYYPFSKYCSGYAETSDGTTSYSRLVPIYSLNILGYNHFPEDDDALRIFQLYDPDRQKSYNKELIRIAFLELKKRIIETENLRHWMDYFNGMPVSDTAPDYIREAERYIAYANMQKEERFLLDQLSRWQADQDAIAEHRYDEGLAIGRDERDRFFVSRMLSTMDFAQISELTGISMSELRNIAEKK